MPAATRKPAPLIPRNVQRRARQSLISLVLVLGLLAGTLGLYKGGLRLAELTPENVTLEELPWAVTLSLFRVLASYFFSLILSFALGLIAGGTRLGERIILPMLDILQSVPVVGFFPAAISFFIGIFSGQRLGVELAAVFLIFTSQAWNMAFAVYEATKTIPQDNKDAVLSFGVKGSQKFWKLYAPACVPRLVYNSILSWSNGWYFLVACEIIAIGNLRYNLPGIGSFLARAAEQGQVRLVMWGLIALTIVVLGFDALVWRPLSIWAERFRQDTAAGTIEAEPVGASFGSQIPVLIYRWARPYRKSIEKVFASLFAPVIWLARDVLLPLFWDLPLSLLRGLARRIREGFGDSAASASALLLGRIGWAARAAFALLGIFLGFRAGVLLVHWLTPPWPEITRQIPMAILQSTGRLVVALAISLAWILPLVLWVWNKPRMRQALMTLAQIGASLPAIALFPLIILVMVKRFGGGMEQASIFLLLTGMQWYILFNALSGTTVIPPDLAEATRAMGLNRVDTWKRLVLPAMRPALITGMITAWGGGWNALVVSEYVTQGDQVLTVNGIGSLLATAVYQLGDRRAIGLCLAAMIAWIILINFLVWTPLYQAAAERYKLDA